MLEDTCLLFIALSNEGFSPFGDGRGNCKWNEMHFKHFGVEGDWIKLCVCVWVCAALADTVCRYTVKERKSESGLSVISVTLSERLYLTNERCWQLGCELSWLCWAGRICFRAFVRFILPLLLSLFLCVSVSFSVSKCQGERWPLVSPKDTSWHSTWWQIDHGGQGVLELPQRWRGFECSILPPGTETADLVRMGKTGKRGGMSQCQKMSKIRRKR